MRLQGTIWRRIMSLQNPINVGQALFSGARVLAEAGVEDARAEAMLLLMFAMSLRREALIIDPDRLLTEQESDAFDNALGQRQTRMPLAYITGERWFYGRPFYVSPDVLIPRPETELLVEFVLEKARNFRADFEIADIGTGSGCIAVTVAAELPMVKVSVVDLSAAALTVAKKNASRHGVSNRIKFFEGDLMTPLTEEKFEIIVSNPPYIKPSDLETLMPEVRLYEPEMALSHGAGDDGSVLHRRLFEQARSLLQEGGWIAVEVGQGQGDSLCLFVEQCGYKSVEKRRDLGGIDRVVAAKWN